MKNQFKMDFKEIIKRSVKIFGFKKNKELAKLLGITPNNLSGQTALGAKSALLVQVIYEIIETHPEVNFDWLITGRGETYIETRNTVSINSILLGEIVERVEILLIKLKRKNAPPIKKAQIIKLLYDYYDKTGEKVSDEKVIEYLKVVK